MGKAKPKASSTSGRWEAAGRPRCFYTGLELQSPSGGNPWGATIEHLVPRYSTTRTIDFNEVFAAHCVNTIVGHAPLKVKYRVRDELRGIQRIERHMMVGGKRAFDGKIIIFPGTTPDCFAEVVKRFTKGILEEYCLEGCPTYPWNFDNAKAADKTRLHEAYWKLLTKEEQELMWKFKASRVWTGA